MTDTPKQFQRILISGADSFKEFPHYEEWILTKDGLVVLGEEIGLSLQTIKVYRDYGRLGPFGLSYDILEHCALVLPCFLPNSEDDVKALIGVAKALDAKRIVWLFDGNEAHDGRIEQWVRSKFSNSIEKKLNIRLKCPESINKILNKEKKFTNISSYDEFKNLMLNFR